MFSLINTRDYYYVYYIGMQPVQIKIIPFLCILFKASKYRLKYELGHDGSVVHRYQNKLF